MSFSRFPARSFSRITRRETTMFRRRLLSLMILNSNFWPRQLVDVRHATQRDLRAGEERVDAHEVDDHATLDLLDERAFDRLIVLVGETDALPHAHEVRLLLREDDRALLVLEVLRAGPSTSSPILRSGKSLELLERDAALRLEADVEHDRGCRGSRGRGL
jgi:hypothetical protein